LYRPPVVNPKECPVGRFSSEELSDLEQIRAAALRYCHGIDRLDPDVMRSAYWPDAIDDHGVFVGNAFEFVDRCMGSHARWRSTLHCVVSHAVEFDDADHARGEIYNVTYLFPHEGGPSLWVGRYLDRYERRDVEDGPGAGDADWRIAHRICVHEGTTVLSESAMPIDTGRFRPADVDRATPGRPLGT
jgi:hypothetical protein